MNPESSIPPANPPASPDSDGLTNQLPVQQPPRKSKRRYISQTEAEQLVLLQAESLKLQAILCEIMRGGKFVYPPASSLGDLRKLADSSVLSGVQLTNVIANLCCILKLMVESGNLDRAKIKNLQKVNLKKILETSYYQGQLTPRRLTELTKKLI